MIQSNKFNLIFFYESILKFLIQEGLANVTLPISERRMHNTPTRFIDSDGNEYFSIADDVSSKLSFLKTNDTTFDNSSSFFQRLRNFSDENLVKKFMEEEGKVVTVSVYHATGKIMTLSS